MRARLFAAAAVAALLLTACGDEAPTKGPPGSPDNPLQALPNPQATRNPPSLNEATPAQPRGDTDRALSDIAGQQRTQARNDARAKASGKPTSARTASGASTARGKLRQPAPSARRPCSLVTRSQAATILGGPVREPLEAPQGPTCIYQTTSDKPVSITLTVQSTDFARLRANVSDRRRIVIADHAGVCGRFGQPMLYLPLGASRVLTISGPCATASRFAAKAVRHL